MAQSPVEVNQITISNNSFKLFNDAQYSSSINLNDPPSNNYFLISTCYIINNLLYILHNTNLYQSNINVIVPVYNENGNRIINYKLSDNPFVQKIKFPLDHENFNSNRMKRFNDILIKAGDSINYNNEICTINKIIFDIDPNRESGFIIKYNITFNGKSRTITFDNSKIKKNVIKSTIKNKIQKKSQVEYEGQLYEVKNIVNVNGENHAIIHMNGNNIEIPLSNLKRAGELLNVPNNNNRNAIKIKKGWISNNESFIPNERVTLRNGVGDPNKLYYIFSASKAGTVKLCTRNQDDNSDCVLVQKPFQRTDIIKADHINVGDIVYHKSDKQRLLSKVMVKAPDGFSYQVALLRDGKPVPGHEYWTNKKELFKVRNAPFKEISKTLKNAKKKENKTFQKNLFGRVKAVGIHSRVTFSNKNKTNKLYYIDDKDMGKEYVKLYSKNIDDDKDIKEVPGIFPIASLSSAEKIEKGDTVILKTDKDRYKNKNTKRYIVKKVSSGNICTLDDGNSYPINELFKILSVKKNTATNTAKKIFSKLNPYGSVNTGKTRYKGVVYNIVSTPGIMSSSYKLKNPNTQKIISVSKKNYDAEMSRNVFSKPNVTGNSSRIY